MQVTSKVPKNKLNFRAPKPRNELLTRSVRQLRVQKLTYKEKIQYFYTKDEYLINRRNEQRGLHMIRNRT